MQKVQAKLFWLGIPVLFIVGSLFHFVYELSGKIFIIGLIAPINESIFEHIKLFPVPAALWYGLIYMAGREKINGNQWLGAALLSIVTYTLSMTLIYYFYTGAFGLKSLAADIITFFIAVSLGQATGVQYYRHGRGLDSRLALLLILAILIFLALLTVSPPHLPMFLDPITHTYGMLGNSALRQNV